MTAAKIMDIISRLPGCDGQAADAVSAGQGDGVPKAGVQQAAADSRGSQTCVCANTQLVNTIHPAPEIHEHFMIHKGYGILCTTSSTLSPTLRPL